MSDEILKIDTSAGLVGNGTSIEKVETFPLVPEDDPILRQVMPEFDFKNPPVDPVKLASQLVETCRAYSGYGLSANQCGLNYRVFVIGTGSEYIACFNPKITKSSQVRMKVNNIKFNRGFNCIAELISFE